MTNITSLGPQNIKNDEHLIGPELTEASKRPVVPAGMEDTGYIPNIDDRPRLIDQGVERAGQKALPAGHIALMGDKIQRPPQS